MRLLKKLFKLSTWNRFFTWDNINAIGRLKVLNYAYYVFLLLPLLVKLMANIDHFSITLDSVTYKLDLTLPFDWQLLYFTSIMLVLANLLYYFICPKIIRLYPDYEHYIKSGMPKIYLHRVLATYYVNQTGAKHINELTNYYNEFVNKHSISGYNVRIALESLRSEDPLAGSNFVFTQNIMSYSYWFLRILTATCYLGGLGLLIWIIIQKTIFTLSYLI